MATSGNNVNAPIFMARANQGTAADNQNGVVLLGLSGPGDVTFAGPIRIEGLGGTSTDKNTLHMLRLTAPANGTARFTGAMSVPFSDPFQGPLQVLGLGDVVLAGNNTSFKGDMLVRSGRLLIGAASAISLGTAPILVGDQVAQPAGGAVRVATRTPLSSNGAAWATGTYTFTSIPTIDGVQPLLGDRILVKDENNNNQPTFRNGIYVVSAANRLTWTRAADLDAAAEFVYGLRVTVTNGTFNTGRAFCLMNRQSVLGKTFTLNSHGVGFNPEPSPNPDVALLTAAALTIAKDVVVTNNFSTGSATLGGATAVSSTFGGAVALHRDVDLTAAAGGTVTFSGIVSGSGSITKTGAGVVRLSHASNSYSGGTSIRVTDAELAAGAKLEVTGTLDLSGTSDTLEILGTPDRDTAYTLVSYGALTGEFDTVTGAPYHTVAYDGPGGTIQLEPLPKGTMILVR